MVLPNFILTGLAGLAGGAILGVIGFAKNKLDDSKVKWDWKMFLWTFVSYALGGAIVGFGSENIFAALIGGLAVDKVTKFFR